MFMNLYLAINLLINQQSQALGSKGQAGLLLLHAGSVTSVVSNSLRPCGLQPGRLLCPWGFSRQEYCVGFPCPAPGNLPNPGIEPRSPALQDLNGQCYSDGPSSPTYSVFLNQQLPQDLLTGTEAPPGTEKVPPASSLVSPACL